MKNSQKADAAEPGLAKERRELERQESAEYYFSESLEKFVARRPLSVDDRIVKAAAESGIELSWDDEGRINNISYLDSKKLAGSLGASFLSPREYWLLRQEAQQAGEKSLIDELQAADGTEWLDAVFIKAADGSVSMIEHPEISEDGGKIVYGGERRPVAMPEARPGWFDPEGNIDESTGLPQNVETNREKGVPGWSSSYWKYWSVFKTDEPVAPIRGYVTSSGTASLDLDIPVGAKQPVLLLRECRKELIEPAIDPELISQAESLIDHYASTIALEPAEQNRAALEEFYDRKESIFEFLRVSGREIFDSSDKQAVRLKEKFIDSLGLIRLLAQDKGDEGVSRQTGELARGLAGLSAEAANFKSFKNFIESSQKRLSDSLDDKSGLIFVMGHKNPDTDTAISCMAEAYRQHLLDPETAYVPVIQSNRIPDEIRRLIGDELADALLLSGQPEYQRAQASGQARWILVDQNVSDVQRFAVALIDHHILADKTERQDIGKTWEMAGSSIALIAQKFQGMGLELDSELSRLLYGTALMDTENRSSKKMTAKDALVMDELKAASGIGSDNEFFQDLMGHLLNTDDAELLFNRDYKQDWGIFGYAVAKAKGVFDESGGVVKQDLLDRLVALGEKNNAAKNFPLTIIKAADYLADNQTVNRERVYLIFNQHAMPEFKQKMFEFVSKIIDSEFQGRAQVKAGENYIDFSGVGDQLSRKVTAPFFEPVVEAFNRHYFSPETALHVQRDFLRDSEEVRQAAEKIGLELFFDQAGRINNITYNEARLLLDQLGRTMMSLSEYWKILAEATASHDEQMVAHLHSPGFVEFLDTVIIDNEYIIDHPRLIKTEEGYEYSGEKKKIAIPEGVPGLIDPADIDAASGFPTTVQDPRQYGDKQLWRYWSPDSPLCVATRGHVFLLNQPSFDTKIHPEDALPNLGVRPCSFQAMPPRVEIVSGPSGVRAEVFDV